MSPGTEPVAVVVDGLGAPLDPGLDALLGERGAAALRATLRARARRWARAVAGDDAIEAPSLAAARIALAGHEGRVLLAAPDVPGLDVELAHTALDDLAAGCDVAVGVAHDARPYVAALARLDAPLLEFVERGFAGGLLAAFAQRDIVLGMLRSERRLSSAADARALALDPLAPHDLAALLADLRGGAR